MTARKEAELLIEQAISAHRERDRRSQALVAQPAWRDLDGAERIEAYEGTLQARACEAALDLDGLSSTARAVLARIR